MISTQATSTPHFHPGARLLAERGNIRIINALAARRAREGVKMGERPAPGAARAAMVLVDIKEAAPLTAAQIQGNLAPDMVDVTRPGFRTARTRTPAILSRLGASDPRRHAADAYAVAAEKIGAMAGQMSAALAGAVDGGAATNDGGVTTRLHHAATLRIAKVVTDSHGITLAVRRASPHAPRQNISAGHLMRSICIEGHDMARILHDAGWAGKDHHVAHLMDAALEILEDLARAFGLVSGLAPRPDLEVDQSV